MNLYFAFTIAGWTLEFSVGFTRTLSITVAVREFGSDQLVQGATVYGTLNPDGTFVPDGVSIEDQHTTG